MENTKNHTFTGTIFAILAFAMWGLLPVYWKQLKSLPALEILGHRMLWSLIFLLLLKTLSGNFSVFKAYYRQPAKLLPFAAGALLLGANWFTYIYAINTNQLVEASMGYFINPLFSIALGLLVFRERLNILQWAAIACAFCGVLYITLHYGRIPWVAILLILTFGIYGLLKKKVSLGAFDSLLFEMLFLLPLTLYLLVPGAVSANSSFLNGNARTIILLMLSGIATATPIALFGAGAKRIPLSSIGFLHYISPSLMLFLGTVVYGEAFTRVDLISFGCIWLGLILYTVSHINNVRRIFNKGAGK